MFKPSLLNIASTSGFAELRAAQREARRERLLAERSERQPVSGLEHRLAKRFAIMSRNAAW